MCGIFGYVTTDAALGGRETLLRALAAMKHRGPDSDGLFESVGSGTRCGMAHARLAIIDLSPGGHQPMSTEDERYTVVFNGEIFNYRDIRRKLEAEGECFRSDSDTEVLLRAYRRWGRECVHAFRGMFAFGIWDRVDASLFLARDRLGIKPLYYTEVPGGLAFASEVRTLMAAGFTSKKLSRRGLNTYLAFGSVAEPDTILEGVRSLPSGCMLTYRAGKSTESRYWEFPLGGEGPTDFGSAVMEVAPLVRESVRLRLIADVPVGVFLSGGIDSSAIVALAAEASQGSVHTFTVTFDESEFSEARYAAEVARAFGCDHHQVHLPASRAMAEFGTAVRALDQPSADGLNTYFVAKAAREAGLRVALSGLGGDEVFAGYPNFRLFGPLTRLAAAGEFFGVSIGDTLAAIQRLGALGARGRKLAAIMRAGDDPAALYAVLRGMFVRDERAALIRPEYFTEIQHDGTYVPPHIERAFASRRRDTVNEFSLLELSNYLRNTLLRDTDAMSMAHGLEVRVPLIDHVLIERVLGIPGPLKIRRSGNKALLTASVPAIPRVAVARPKMGFSLPFSVWFRGPLRPRIESVLGESFIQSLGFLNVERVRELWQSFLADDGFTSWSRIWCIGALAEWCREHRVTA